MTIVLGINSAYHEPSACLIINGKVIAAVEEERFNRKRHGKLSMIDNSDELPFQSINYCLKLSGTTMEQVDYIAYSFDPIARFTKNIGLPDGITPNDWGSLEGESKFYKLNMKVPRILEEHYGTRVDDKFHWIPHHVCHSASAYFASPFNDAAVLSVDGIGEFGSVLMSHGKDNIMRIFQEEGAYPSSIGLLWTKISQFLGLLFDGMAEYTSGKVMALAAYGNPDKYYDTFRKFVHYDEGGKFEIAQEIMQFRNGNHEPFERLLGLKVRKEGEELSQDYIDLAAALQKITNEIMLIWANKLHELTGSKYLCMAGGCTLNCISNSYILENGPFEDIFVQPGANDMGTALGAALYVANTFADGKRSESVPTPYLGPEYTDNQIKNVLKSTKGISFRKSNDVCKETAKLLSQQKIIAWFQGREEFGPRALGNRSFLADPRKREMFHKLSIDVKGREWYRPLAPMVLAEEADKWFIRPKGGAESDQWMLFSYKVQENKKKMIPAVVHEDGTGRIQSVMKENNQLMYKLLSDFKEITGVPVLINTSFNIREPIVCSPEDAVKTFLKQGAEGIDTLVIGNYMVIRK